MMGLPYGPESSAYEIGAVFMAISLDPELAMVFLISIPVLAVALGLIMKNAFPRFDRLQSMFDRLNNNVEENATNVRVVKSFVREEFEKEKFEKSNSLLYKAAWGAIRLVVMDMPIMTLVMNVNDYRSRLAGRKIKFLPDSLRLQISWRLSPIHSRF